MRDVEDSAPLGSELAQHAMEQSDLVVCEGDCHFIDDDELRLFREHAHDLHERAPPAVELVDHGAEIELSAGLPQEFLRALEHGLVGLT